MLLVIFGLPGAGKSYIANILAEVFGFFHYDGDYSLPRFMKKAILNKEIITDQQREIFFNRLITKMKHITTQYEHVVISQTFIK